MKIGKWILADTPIRPSRIPFPLTPDQKQHRHNTRDGQHVTWRVYLIKYKTVMLVTVLSVFVMKTSREPPNAYFCVVYFYQLIFEKLYGHFKVSRVDEYHPC